MSEPMQPGRIVTLDVERAAAGGWMIARHGGRVILVAGAIPGERVDARLDRVKGQVAFATTVAVASPSPDRRQPEGDPACGGSAFAHVNYERQLSLKREILADAFLRLAHLRLPATIGIHPSPERGYRMRARLHVHAARVGFYREGTHELCDPRSTGQLSEAAADALDRLGQRLAEVELRGRHTLELAENRAGDQRVLAVELEPGAADLTRAQRLVAPLEGCTGLAVTRAGHIVASTGSLAVSDELDLAGGSGTRASLALRRRVGSFFQGNRFLLGTLVDRVLAYVPRAAVTDLYAGSGLFGLAAAAVGAGPVSCVEADRSSLDDLRANAARYPGKVTVSGQPVEAYVARNSPLRGTVIVDPPRTGVSRDALAGLASSEASRIVYVSCDVATLARDAGRLCAAGYAMAAVELLDLFPNTAHVESLVVFDSERNR